MRWLIAALDKRASGTVRLWSDVGEHRLHLRRGVPVAIDTPNPHELEMLRATALFALPGSVGMEITPSEDFDPRCAVDIRPLDLITRGLRAFAGQFQPLELVAPLRHGWIRLRDSAPIAQLGLLDFELKVVDALRAAPRTFDDLTEARLVHVRALCATLFILDELRFLDGDYGPPIQEEPARRMPPPPKPKQLVVSIMPTAEELQSRLTAMADETWFEILGVETTATDDDIRAALAQRLYQFHPSRLHPSHHRLATLICARLNGAARQLADPQARAEYAETLTERSVPEDLPALMAQAERQARGREFADAQTTLLTVLTHDDAHPDALTLLDWCQAESMAVPPVPAGKRTNQLNPQLRTLRRVVVDHPGHVRARYYFAQLLKRTGRIEAAMNQFRIVVAHDPRHVGAARELNLQDIRQRKLQKAGVIQRMLEWRS